MSLETFQSTNFQVQFENTEFTPAELAVVRPRAQNVLNGFETDYATFSNWFGIVVGEGLGITNRVFVTLTKNIRGASNGGYSNNHPRMTVNVNIGGTDDSVLSLFAAEMIEILMSYKGNWNAGDSGGEGLSRVAAELLHPNSVAPGGGNVNAWLAFDPTIDATSAVADSEYRKNWVDQNFKGGNLRAGGFVPGDQDSYSFGCSILFIFYLKDQLGFSMPQIVQNGGATLAETYKNLTGTNVDPFLNFNSLLSVHYPKGAQSSSDNPFPLKSSSSSFDVQFYLNHYPDLKAAFGNNYAAAIDHWSNQGLPIEGRRGSREFDVQFYLGHYSDLQAAFGNNYTAAIDHWLNKGLPIEERRGSREFDVQFYLNHYPDLKTAFGNNYTAAIDHWSNQGLPNEGRCGSREFDVQFYLNHYPDLKTAFGNNYTAAIDHWINQGLPNEGRHGSREFDVQFYFNHYPDLQTAFGNNYTANIDHWINQGLPNEGRRGSQDFDVQFYLASYPDLQAAFGKNYTAAFDHWVNFGIAEGRKGAP
jgi:uncharacterized protein YaeQ